MNTTVGIQAVKVENASASDDGQQVLIGFDVGQESPLNLIIPADQAMNLMSVLSAAAGHAARNRNADPNTKHVFPVDWWEVGAQPDTQMILFSWRLPGGMELSFQIHRDAAARMHEVLGNALGAEQTSVPPGTQPH